MSMQSGGKKLICKRWWFWLVALVLVLVLAIPAWFAFQYVSYYVKHYIRGFSNGIGVGLVQYQSARLEKAYREDTYGGDTPEETLELYMQALEAKNYKLASKYYIPEDQKEHERLLNSAEEQGDGLEKYLASYRAGGIEGILFEDGKMYEIEIDSLESEYPYLERFILNPLTNKWKLVGLE